MDPPVFQISVSLPPLMESLGYEDVFQILSPFSPENPNKFLKHDPTDIFIPGKMVVIVGKCDHMVLTAEVDRKPCFQLPHTTLLVVGRFRCGGRFAPLRPNTLRCCLHWNPHFLDTSKGQYCQNDRFGKGRMKSASVCGFGKCHSSGNLLDYPLTHCFQFLLY